MTHSLTGIFVIAGGWVVLSFLAGGLWAWWRRRRKSIAFMLGYKTGWRDRGEAEAAIRRINRGHLRRIK
jgi:hypothetical protein